MTKEEFQHLLRRYRDGNCSAEETQKINTWFAKISDEKLQLSDDEKGQVSERMLQAIRQSLSKSPKKDGLTAPRFLVLKVAASFILLGFVLFLLVPHRTINSSERAASTQSQPNLIEHTNTTKEVVAIHLPDSSTVKLKPTAKISYSKTWDEQKREVHLIGEAFFEVVKDSSRPFYVYGGAIVTKVLGTSFSIKAALDSESVEVSVHTGKVSVYEDPQQKDNASQSGTDGSGVILTPNEKVEYFVNDKHWVTSLVEKPQSLPASNKAVDFIFNSTPMSEIVESIERTYSIGVVLESEASYACTFTGDVSMMELYDMLDVICKSTGTSYEVKGTKILITGRGCE